MKYRLLNYVACPYCKDKGFPLRVIVFETVLYENRKLPEGVEKPLCDIYCAYRGTYTKNLKEYPCDECIKIEVKNGVLVCTNCKRWYPIIDEIPRMLPDNYRKEDEDRAFLKMYEYRIPDDIKKEGKPFSLT